MSDEKHEKFMVSRRKNDYSQLLHMAPTDIFRFFEKSSDRFFEVGHLWNFINVQNLRGPSEFSGIRMKTDRVDIRTIIDIIRFHRPSRKIYRSSP